MGIISVGLFFIYMWGFGFGLLKLLRVKEGAFLERQLMRTGIGISAISILAIIFSLIGIPLDWKIFLIISVLGPLIYLARNFKILESKIKNFELKTCLRKSNLNVFLVLLIFSGSLHMYASGAFAYQYLEDDDSWGHAAGVKYVAEEKTFSKSPYREFQYMNPYPPSYDFILALMHQTESSLQWTMKFFNALIVSLSLVYFYFFAKEFTGNRNKALFATVVLAAVPAYLSHFIWAPALAMTLFFPALYALEMMKRDKKWKWVAGVAIAGLLMSQPTHPIILFSMILVYLFVKVISEKNLTAYGTAALSGIALSLSWWGTSGRALFRDHGAPQKAAAVLQDAGFFEKMIAKLPTAFAKNSGSATRAYDFQDFFIAKGQNLINNPTGFGIAVTILTIIGATFITILASVSLVSAIVKVTKSEKIKWHLNRKNGYLIIISLWFIFAFIIVNSTTFDLPVGFYAFRAWMILAVPVALIATEGLWSFYALLSPADWARGRIAAAIVYPFKRYDRELIAKITPVAKVLILILAITGIAFTSAQQKYEVNTANWPPGVIWTSFEEIDAYVWLKTLPHDTKVFSFITDDQVIGFDKFSCGWCEAEATYRQKGFNDSAEETAGWMKDNGYEYVIFGGMEIRKYGENQTFQKLQDIGDSGLFRVAHENLAVTHNCASDYSSQVPAHNCTLEHTNQELVHRCNSGPTEVGVIHNCNQGLVHTCALELIPSQNAQQTGIRRKCSLDRKNLGIILNENPDAQMQGAIIFGVI